GCFVFFFSSRRRHTIFSRDWSSDVCSSDLEAKKAVTGLKSAYAQTLDPVGDAAQSMVWADVAICDTSAMAYDAVALNIPLLLSGDRPSKLLDGLPLGQHLGNANGLAQRVAELAASGVAGAQKQL